MQKVACCSDVAVLVVFCFFFMSGTEKNELNTESRLFLWGLRMVAEPFNERLIVE